MRELKGVMEAVLTHVPVINGATCGASPWVSHTPLLLCLHVSIPQAHDSCSQLA